MECNPLTKEALDHISRKINQDYRFPEAAAKIFKSSKLMKASHVLSSLKNQGVTEREIKSLGLYSYLKSKGDTRISLSEVNNHAKDIIETKDLGKAYDWVTYDSLGEGNPTYKETGFIQKAERDVPNSHYLKQAGETLTGWNRTAASDFKGEKVMYMFESQSDWAQTERAGTGRGIFESNKEGYTKGRIYDKSIYAKVIKYYTDNLSSMTKTTKDIFDKALTYNASIEAGAVDVASLAKVVDKEVLDTFLTDYKPKRTSDFEMGEVTFNKLAIIDTLNKATEQGLNKVIIPIDGRPDTQVSKFYKNLDLEVLPTIRKALAKHDMVLENNIVKIDNPEGKMYYGVTVDDLDVVYEGIEDAGLDIAPLVKKVESTDKGTIESMRKIEDFISKHYGEKYTLRYMHEFKDLSVNRFHELTLKDKGDPTKRVSIDLFGILGALGLTSAYNKLEEEE